MDDPRDVVARGGARFWLAAGVAVLGWLACCAAVSAQDMRAYWLQEPVPEDAPVGWGGPSTAVYPEWNWADAARLNQGFQAVNFNAPGMPEPPGMSPAGMSQPPGMTQPGMTQPPGVPDPPGTALPSSRRRFQLVSQQESDSDSSDSPPDAGDAPSGDEDSADGQKAPTTLGQKPQTNTMQFLRAQDVLLKKGAWQFDMGFAYTLFETPFPVAATDTSGAVVDVVSGVVRRRLLYSPFAFRYGLSSDVQVFGVMPVGYANTQTSTEGTSIINNSGGQGDFTGGASFHVLKAHDDHPDGIMTWSVTAPTGEYTSPLGGTGAVIPGFALGQGYWALAAQMLFINRYDPVIVYYGAGCRHLFQRRFDGIMVTAGEQISYQVGVGFSVNDRITLSTTLQGFYITNTQLNGVTERGSNIEPISIRFATTIARRCRILEPFAVVGMTPTAPAASVGVTWTFY